MSSPGGLRAAEGNSRWLRDLRLGEQLTSSSEVLSTSRVRDWMRE